MARLDRPALLLASCARLTEGALTTKGGPPLPPARQAHPIQNHLQVLLGQPLSVAQPMVDQLPVTPVAIIRQQGRPALLCGDKTARPIWPHFAFLCAGYTQGQLLGTPGLRLGGTRLSFPRHDAPRGRSVLTGTPHGVPRSPVASPYAWRAARAIARCTHPDRMRERPHVVLRAQPAQAKQSGYQAA